MALRSTDLAQIVYTSGTESSPKGAMLALELGSPVSKDLIATLARLSNESPTRKALREELAQGVNLAVHVGRTAAGAYRVMEISEVLLGEERRADGAFHQRAGAAG